MSFGIPRRFQRSVSYVLEIQRCYECRFCEVFELNKLQKLVKSSLNLHPKFVVPKKVKTPTISQDIWLNV